MTRPNGQPCKRCGGERVGGRGLCENCRGTCAKCGGPASVRPDGYFRTYCEPCRRVAEQRETCSICGKARDGSHQSYCRECYREYEAQWAKNNPEKVAEKMWRHDLKRTYGLTVDDWNAMLAAQDGGCAVCRTGVPSGRGRFHVDHCHSSGKIRGLLCTTCNVALGMVGDDPVRLRALADYLERHAAQPASPST